MSASKNAPLKPAFYKRFLDSAPLCSVDHSFEDSDDQRKAMMHSPIPVGRYTPRREIGSEVFISLLGRSTGEAQEVLALRTTQSAKTFTDVGRDRLCRFAKLAGVEQLPPRSQQLVDLVNHRSGRIQQWESLVHALRMLQPLAPAASFECTPAHFIECRAGEKRCLEALFKSAV